ncbi:protein 1a [Babaco ilarvirus 1]|nr:protein 1a [Babaco ilarvirus 1]
MDHDALATMLVDVFKKHSINETTAIGKALADRGCDIIERTLPRAQGERLNIGFILSAEQQAALRRNFPGRDIHFTQSDSSSHSYAAAHRLLETDFIYKCFGTTDEPVIDLGGNFTSHLKRHRYNVHSCCPLLDDRDGARYTERFISLKTYLRTHKNELHEPDYCNHRFEDCPRKAHYVMSVHSISDLPLTDLCRALASKGTKKMILSVMMDPNMLIRDQGEIPMFDVRWEIDKKNDKIMFDFINAPCLGYEHKFSVLKSYMTTNAVVVGKNKAYRIERKADMGGVFIIDITEVAGYHAGMPVGTARSCAWLNLLKNKTVVHTVEGFDHWLWDVEKRSHVLVDTKVLTRVLEASFRQYKETTTPETAVQNIATMLSSSTNYTIINGVTLQAGESLMFDDYVAIATTIYVRTKKLYDEIKSNIARLRVNRLVDVSPEIVGQVGAALGYINNMFSGEFVQHLTDKKGGTSDYHCQSNMKKTVRDFFNYLRGKEGSNTRLLSDPNLFVPLEVVLETTWKESSVLTVEAAREEIVGPELDRIAAEKIARRDAMLKDEKLTRSIHMIAKWIESNPTGEVPKGMGKVIPLIPDMCDKHEYMVVDKTPGLVVNKYASEIQEAINYYETELETNDKKLSSVGSHCEWSVRNITTVWSGDESRRIFVPYQRKWLGPPSVLKPGPTAKYERGLTKTGYVLLDWEKDSLELTRRCCDELQRYPAVFFDRSCEFASGLRIVPALKEAIVKEAKFTRKLVDGVAGCGKTTQILAEGKLSGDTPDLFLTSNRSSAIELRERLVGSMLNKSVRVRTCDSYLMNSRRPSTERLIFDECFLQHAGCVYAAATLSDAKELIMFGDTKQIPFVSRVTTMKLKNHVVGADEKVNRYKTYRSPIDTTMALSKWFYRHSVQTANRTMRSMKITPINSLVQVDPSWDLYLTQTQEEKYTLIAAGKIPESKIFTTHEAQGKTAANVALVRTTRTSKNIYSGKDPILGPCHCLVALSRHTKKFNYFTFADSDSDDLIAKAIRDVGNESDEKVYSYLHTDHKI